MAAKTNFEYDPEKNRGNLKKHGIDFVEAQVLWNGSHVIIPAKNVIGEKRFAILGRVRQKVYAAIFTKRVKSIRIISCRRANKKWEKIFYECLQKENNKEE